MEIYYSNINKINEEVEEFVIAKSKIEKPLLYNDEIEKKMSIKEFIDFVNLTQNTFIIGDNEMHPIAFNIFNPEKDVYVIIYSATVDDEKISIFKNKLENIQYDLTKLTNISQLDLLNGKIDINNDNYFIINNEFYK